MWKDGKEGRMPDHGYTISSPGEPVPVRVAKSLAGRKCHGAAHLCHVFDQIVDQ